MALYFSPGVIKPDCDLGTDQFILGPLMLTRVLFLAGVGADQLHQNMPVCHDL